MTDRSKLLALAEAVEALSEPSIEIDTEIARTVYADNCRNPDWECGPVLPYTASLDAAMTLVPEGWDWKSGESVDGYGVASGRACVESRLLVQHGSICVPNSDRWIFRASATTPAPALCAAALRAQAEALALRAKEQSEHAKWLPCTPGLRHSFKRAAM